MDLCTSLLLPPTAFLFVHFFLFLFFFSVLSPKTCSTHSLAASSVHATILPTFLADCAAFLTSTWPPSAAFWTTISHTRSTHVALLCSTRHPSGWTNSAPGAWRPLSWRRWPTYAKLFAARAVQWRTNLYELTNMPHVTNCYVNQGQVIDVCIAKTSYYNDHLPWMSRIQPHL